MSAQVERAPFTVPGYAHISVVARIGDQAIARCRGEDGRLVLIQGVAGDFAAPDEIRRLRREWEVLKAIRSERVLRARDLIRDSRNRDVILFEDPGSTPLDRHLAMFGLEIPASPDAPRRYRLDVGSALDIVCGVVEALAQVHRLGALHLAINTDAVWVDPNGAGRLGGFANAVVGRQNDEHVALAAAHLAWSAPELIRRVDGRPPDQRSDLYGVGALLYVLLTGVVPFPGDEPLGVLRLKTSVPLVPVQRYAPHVPDTLWAIIARLLSPTPEDRYRGATGLLHDLVQCRDQWRHHEHVDDFEIGAHDVSERFTVPPLLFGRERELATLQEAFSAKLPGSLILLSGPPGIGKSTLAHELRQSVVRSQGLFVEGNFDQVVRNTPHHSLIQAFERLLDEVLSASPARLPHWRAQIDRAVGANAGLLMQRLPRLARVLGARPSAPEIGAGELDQRLKSAMRSFLACFSSPENPRPLVLFLDDLQWADPQSLTLISDLLVDPRYGHLTILGAYRSTEVDAEHPLMRAIQRVTANRVPVTTIEVAPLSVEAIEDLLASAMRTTHAEARPLAEILSTRTLGNPLELGEMLRALYRRDGLTFDAGSGTWRASLETLASLGVGQNIIQFLETRIRSMSAPVQDLLEIAACLGGTFDVSTLAEVASLPPQTVAARIGEACEEGLLLPADTDAHSPGRFRFAHDRVQQAALAGLDELALRRLRLDIARKLVECMANGQRTELIFDAMSHATAAKDLVTDLAERDLFARLNLQAAEHARSTAAYEAALGYLRDAMTFGGEGLWQRDPDLALQVYASATEAAWLCGQFAEADALADRALEHALAPLDRAALLRAKVEIATNRDQYAVALDFGRRALHELGLRSAGPGMLSLGVDAVRALANLLRLGVDGVASLPQLTDPRALNQLRMIAAMSAPAYFYDADTFFSLVLKAVNISFRGGRSALAAQPLALFGMVLTNGPVLFEHYVGAAGRYLPAALLSAVDRALATRADQLSDLVLAWTEQDLSFAAQRARTKMVIGGFTRPWTRPSSACIPMLRDGIDDGVRYGDLLYATYCSNAIIYLSFPNGTPLDEIDKDNERTLDLTRRHLALDSYYAAVITRQTIRCLQNRTYAPDSLSDDHMNESELLQEISKLSGQVPRLWYLLNRARISYLHGNPRRALLAAEQGWSDIRHIVGLPIVREYALLYALAITGCWNAANEEERRGMRTRVERLLRLMRRWYALYPANVEHHIALVSAECARCWGDPYEAASLYDQAISGARAVNHLHEEAIALELAGRFYLDLDRIDSAVSYLRHAEDVFRTWGAAAKAGALAEENRERLPAAAQLPRFDLTTDPASQDLDLATVWMASQAILAENRLDRVLTRLVQISLEMAGADRVIWAMEAAPDDWRIEAEGSADADPTPLHPARPATPRPRGTEGTRILHGAPLSARDDLPIRLLLFALRNDDAIALANVREHPLFADEECFAHRGAVSVYCAPLKVGDRVVGILYLENGRMRGAFSNDRRPVLEALSGQFALAVDHARTLDQIERAVETRTAQLESTRNEMFQWEKMASLGVMAAGVAHELNSPIGVVRSAAEQLSEALRDGSSSGPRLVRLADLCVQASGRAAEIVNNLRAFSRPGQVDPEFVNLASCFESTLAILSPSVRAQSVSLHVSLSDLPEVQCFPALLNQVFMNLLINAMQAIGEGGQIWIDGALVDGDRVRVTIRDDGPGIAAEHRHRIFEPFFSTKGAGQGTGLGLSICYSIIVDRHGGRIREEGTPGGGARFVIDLHRRLPEEKSRAA